MADVLIIGASTGGVPVAYELRAALGRDHRVTLVGAGEHFSFVPSNPWVAIGQRSRADTGFPLGPYLERRGVDWVPVPAETLMLDRGRVRLANGRELRFDYLVLATGPRLAFEEVPGLGPSGNSHSICTIDHAEQCWSAWRRFVADPGPMVIGAVQGASCFGPAYEYAFLADAELRRLGLRARAPIMFVTAEPHLGHFGIGDLEDADAILEEEFAARGIDWVVNARVDAVHADCVAAEEVVPGVPPAARTFPSRFTMLIPPFRGVPLLDSAGPGFCDASGHVIVDAFQRSPLDPRVFAVGVCVSMPRPEATPVPVASPKTGYLIETQGAAIVRNICAAVRGEPPSTRGTLNAVCLLDMGETGMAFAAIPQRPPRRVAWMKRGRWVHLAKIAFEKYYLRKIRSGSTDPLYERYLLKAMGIEKTE